MNIQEQEEIDFNWGRQTELQNAFELGRIQTGRIENEMSEVRRLSKLGFWVAVDRIEVCCPHTDALIGTAIVICGISSIAEELEHHEEDGILYAPELIWA